MENKVVSAQGYTQAELDAAFKEIQNAEHWKNPIDAWIHPNRFDICNEACIYFTGSGLTRRARRGNHCVRVTAPGYYQTIGA